jgi:hypothetical protein
MRRYLSCCLQIGSPRWKNVIKWIIIIGEKATSEYLQGLDKLRSLEEGSDLQFLKSSSRCQETE